ncbi:hypothetical protein KGM_205486 [Danaus plexippus plexippus]|uniref:Uncharacterized protein n=1 Tax=Danaus plexippus plexippus TaxID=278856 RepID=A0A212EVU2_DANPL|nr:uncharacterized protein LOC116770624 [Danaus plexippus plexippus]OWR45618.1 hypothetical protein KGM_205486 [Danaus plexippus plexippus]
MKCFQNGWQTFCTVTKCCCCVPIRKGVVIFGYFNLVLSLLSFPLLIFLLVEELMGEPVRDYSKSRYVPLIHLPMTIFFVLVDVVMTIILLVGAHKKKIILLKVYLYFGLVFQSVTFCMDLIYFDYREYIENSVYFFFLGLNLYLLFLVYNTLKVINEKRDVQYVTYQENGHFI